VPIFWNFNNSIPFTQQLLPFTKMPTPAKNMSYQSIVRAIANIESAEYSLENQFLILNQWNY
jgi:hypothetical protein